MKGKKLLYSAVIGVTLIGSFSTFAEDKYSIVAKWQNFKLTAKVVNNISHNNIIDEAKKPEWVLVKKSGDPNGYSRICLPSYKNICLYATYDNDLRTGYLIGRKRNQYLWKFNKVPFKLNNGKDTVYKIINLDGKKIHWEENKPKVAFEDGTNYWWFSSFFSKDKVSKPPVIVLPSNVLLNKNSYVWAKRTRTYTLTPTKNGVLTVDLTGLSSDLDLYVKQGKTKVQTSEIIANRKVRTIANDGYCAPFKDGNESENCTIDVVKGEKVYIRIYASDQYSSFNIKASFTNAREVRLPFVRDKPWYVCQGYNGWISHHGNNRYAFDLSVNPDYGKHNACLGDTIASQGEKIISPVTGVVSYVYDGAPNTSGVICINISEGEYSGYSVQLGHTMNFFRRTGDNVNKGFLLGFVDNNTAGSGIYSHIHIALFRERNCITNIPLGDFLGTGTDFNAKFDWQRTTIE